MTDVAAIVSALDAGKVLLRQVITLAPGGFDLPAATAQELESLLDGVFADQVYPVELPEHANHPSCVYTLVGVEPHAVDGYRITQTDLYRLTIRAERYASLDTLLRSVITALRTSAYSIEPIDVAVAMSDDQRVFVAAMDIECTYVADASGATPGTNAAELPAALVYPIGRSAGESLYDNLVKQVVTDTYGIILVTADGDIPALMTEVRGILLGFQQSAAYFAMEYQSGANLGGVAGMELWREIYIDRHAITEA